MQIDSGMNLYDACQSERENFDKLDPVILNRNLNDLKEWSSSFPNTKYFMLLCNEIRYYTVFNLIEKDFDKFAQEVKECAEYRGDIIEISEVDDGSAFEIWIKEKSDNKPHMFMLFAYDWGVIEVGEKNE